MSHLDLVAHLEAIKRDSEGLQRDLEGNREETRQLLEAAEQLEAQNAANRDRAQHLENQLYTVTQDKERQAREHSEQVMRMERERQLGIS